MRPALMAIMTFISSLSLAQNGVQQTQIIKAAYAKGYVEGKQSQENQTIFIGNVTCLIEVTYRPTNSKMMINAAGIISMSPSQMHKGKSTLVSMGTKENFLIKESYSKVKELIYECTAGKSRSEFFNSPKPLATPGASLNEK